MGGWLDFAASRYVELVHPPYNRSMRFWLTRRGDRFGAAGLGWEKVVSEEHPTDASRGARGEETRSESLEARESIWRPGPSPRTHGPRFPTTLSRCSGAPWPQAGSTVHECDFSDGDDFETGVSQTMA